MLCCPVPRITLGDMLIPRNRPVLPDENLKERGQEMCHQTPRGLGSPAWLASLVLMTFKVQPRALWATEEEWGQLPVLEIRVFQRSALAGPRRVCSLT